METEPGCAAPVVFAEEKGEKAQGAFSGTVPDAGSATAGDVSREPAQVPPQVYPQSKGKFKEGSLEVEQSKPTQAVEVKPVSVSPLQQTEEVVRPVIDSPVRSQPQEEHSYPRTHLASGRPPVPPRKASEAQTKTAQLEETSRGLDLDPKPSVGFRMKVKLAWMGLKTKVKH